MARPRFSRRSISLLKVSSSVLVCLAAALTAGAGGARRADVKPATAHAGRFTVFESGQVRPLALSPSGKFLFAANTPDNRLEVFRILGHGLEHRASISVGAPGSIAMRMGFWTGMKRGKDASQPWEGLYSSSLGFQPQAGCRRRPPPGVETPG